MFAIFENGGKQYKVKKDDVVIIDKVNCKKNDSLKFDNILLLKDQNGETNIGTPYVKDAQIKAKVLDVTKDKKVLIFKKKRRHNYRRKLGHRQSIIVLKIEEILFGKVKTKIESKEKEQISKKIGRTNGT